MVNFRFGNTDLYIHKHRYDTLIEMLCPLCEEEDEGECHVLVRFPAVDDLRQKYIVPHVIENCNNENCNLLIYLMKNEEQNIIRAVSTYLYHYFKRRESARMNVY